MVMEKLERETTYKFLNVLTYYTENSASAQMT